MRNAKTQTELSYSRNVQHAISGYRHYKFGLNAMEKVLSPTLNLSNAHQQKIAATSTVQTTQLPRPSSTRPLP